MNGNTPTQSRVSLFISLLLLSLVFGAASNSFAENDLKDHLKEMQEAYLREPNSERAHIRSLSILVSQKKYSEAKKVVTSLQELNPASKQAEAYFSQISELEALSGQRIPKEMRKRHLKELTQAAMDDAFSGQNEEEKEFAQSFLKRGKQDDFMQKAMALNEKKKAKVKERFPNLCEHRKKASKSAADNWKLKSELMKIQAEKGNQELRKVYPEMLEKRPDNLFLIRDYAEFLLRDEKLKEAETLTADALKKFPKDPKLILIKEELSSLHETKSEERKSALVRALQSQLLALSLAEADCMMKSFGTK